MKLYAFIIALGFVFTLSSQAQNCEIPQALAEGTFDVQVPPNIFQKGVYGQQVSHLKAPKTSTEVNKVDFMECSGYLPNRAKITQIKIIAVSGLPQGLNWYCDTDDCSWKGNAAGCFFIEGTTDDIGTFPLEIVAEGTGSLFGISKTYTCYLRDYRVVVE